jgi:asparagine synthase (glutamine-hydrolysing)
VNTFSIGFEENEYNELPYARMVAEQYKTRHHEIFVKPDSIELTHLLVRSFDEPFGDSSAIPTYIVSEFAARHVKVALSGDGGDELFGGYESFWLVDKFRKLDMVPQWMRQIGAAIASRLPYGARGTNFLHMLSRPSAFARYMELNYSPTLLRRNLLTEEWMIPAHSLGQRFAGFLPQKSVDPVAESMYFEITAKLPSDMLVKVDRMSMAASLEVRSPMLDHKLAELAARLPHAWKMQNNKGKLILLEALGDRLPPALLKQPKRGFGVPMASWFRNQLRPMLRDMLTSKAFSDRRFANPRFVQYMLDEHDSGRRDNSFWLWHLLMLEMWFRESNLAAQPARPLAHDTR